MWSRSSSGRLQRTQPICQVNRHVLGHIAAFAGSKTIVTSQGDTFSFVKTRRDGSTVCRLGEKDFVIPKVATVRVFGLFGLLCTM
jgi:hypothetical protein